MPRHVSAGRGSHWIDSGWQVFRAAPLRWFAMLLLLGAANIAISLIPGVGGTLGLLLNPAVAGCLLIGVQTQTNGGSLQPSHLIAGFRHAQFPQLVLLGLANLVLITLISVGAVIVMELVRSGSGNASQAIEATSARRSGPELMITLALAGAGGVAIGTMAWLAPHLVVLDRRSALEALRLSFTATLRNVGALLVFALESLLISLALAIPLTIGIFANSIAITIIGGLILVCWFFVLLAASYFAWLDIFGEAPLD